jgi:cation transport regulator
MPYRTLSELPDRVADHLPKHAQEIFMEAYNSAWDQYADPDKRRDEDDSREEVANRVAWAAVKHLYEKDEKSGRWKRKAVEVE